MVHPIQFSTDIPSTRPIQSPHPIQFSIPECKLIKYENIPEKTLAFANCMPTFHAQYIYDEEEPYYRGYQTAFFGLTKKKGGFDCMRHYEILANGCIPWFEGIDTIPPNTMVMFPKKLVKEAMMMPGINFEQKTIDFDVFDTVRYYEILRELLEYTANHLTTRAMARYVLDTIGYQPGEKILFLSNLTDPDYLRCLTLIGLKENIGNLCVDIPRIPHIYKSAKDVRGLYGKGMTYTCILDDNRPRLSAGTEGSEDDEIDEDIERTSQPLSKYKHIIYGSVHRGLPMYCDIIKNELFPKEHIWFFCGEDQHETNFPCDEYGSNLFLREQLEHCEYKNLPKIDSSDVQEIINRINTFAPEKFPEVYDLKENEILPFNPHNWFNQHDIFDRLLSSKPGTKLAVEVGSWMGGSARHIASRLTKDSLLVCVDTWLGSEEHQPGGPWFVIDLDLLYRQFLSNTVHANLHDRMIPVRMSSLEAARKMHEMGIKFDFIYIDASHDYNNVKTDLNAWYQLLAPEGIFCGDHFHHLPIQWATGEFVNQRGLQLKTEGKFWQLV